MIIGITGNIGSGKSTISTHLIEKYLFTEYSFAQPLKQIGEIFKFEKSELYGTQEEKRQINSFWGISGREFLQKLGTDVFRNHLPTVLPEMENVWIRLFEHQMAQKKGNYVISDVRFVDEAKAIQSIGGIVVKLNRTMNREGEEHKHSSELELNQIVPNFVIDNNGSKDELIERMDLLISSLN